MKPLRARVPAEICDEILAGTFIPSGKVVKTCGWCCTLQPLRWKPRASRCEVKQNVTLHVPPRVPAAERVPPEQAALYNYTPRPPQVWPALRAKLAREAAAAERYAHVQPRGTRPVRLPDMLDLHVAAQLLVSNLKEHSPVGATGIECRAHVEPTRLDHLYRDSRLGWALQKALRDG